MQTKEQILAGTVTGLFFLLILMCGCATELKKEYYETGQLKSDYSRTGCIKLSDGPGKTVNTPLSHISGVNTR